jgi:hypothetical protein
MDSRRVCDPMAVSSTLYVRKQLGQSGTEGLTELRKEIYSAVVERVKISRDQLEKLLKISPEKLEQLRITRNNIEAILRLGSVEFSNKN